MNMNYESQSDDNDACHTKELSQKAFRISFIKMEATPHRVFYTKDPEIKLQVILNWKQ